MWKATFSVLHLLKSGYCDFSIIANFLYTRDTCKNCLFDKVLVETPAFCGRMFLTKLFGLKNWEGKKSEMKSEKR